MDEDPYSKRELDEKFAHLADALHTMSLQNEKNFTEVKARLDYTNGKVKRHALVLTCVGSIVATLLVTNGSELVHIFKIII